MANLLESLAMGLKSAGGTLNPQVYAGNEQEYQNTIQNNRAQENALRSMVMQAQMRQQMQQQDPEYQARLQALRNEQGYRKALESLPPDAPLEEQAKLAMRFGKPEIAAQFVKAREDRATREQQFALTMEQKRSELEGRLREAQNNRASREELARIAQEGRADMLRLAASLRQPPQPQMITNNDGVFQIGRDGVATPVVDTSGKPLTGKPQEKALPATAAKGLLENNQNLRRAESALALIEGKDQGEMKGDKNATGLKGFLPDAVLQRVDPEGIDARAAIADLGSLVIHDRSGAAVTAAEFPRLQPFIPSSRDDPETVKKKLKRFVQVYKGIVDDTKGFYKDSGFKVPDSVVGTGGSGEWTVTEKK